MTLIQRIIILTSILSLPNFSASAQNATNSPTYQPDYRPDNFPDLDDQQPKPPYQGNSPADLDTTAIIRRQILACKNLSLNGQNVKVITNNGRVTLRGPVNSMEEKLQIGKLAATIAAHNQVNNQLEVQDPTGPS